jgi:hypothetical protein
MDLFVQRLQTEESSRTNCKFFVKQVRSRVDEERIIKDDKL